VIKSGAKKETDDTVARLIVDAALNRGRLQDAEGITVLQPVG